MPMKKEDKLSPPQLTPESISKISEMLEQFAGVSTEAMGSRNPGERCMYEIQRKQTLDSI